MDVISGAGEGEGSSEEDVQGARSEAAQGGGWFTLSLAAWRGLNSSYLSMNNIWLEAREMELGYQKGA